MRAFSRMNYDAIGLGERDFWQSVNLLREIEQKYQIPFVSANIYHPDGKTPFFKPYIIKTLPAFENNGHRVPEIRIGIFGLLFKRLQLVKDENDPQLVVGDPFEAAKKVVAELKTKCDLIIALAHIRYPHVKDLAYQLTDIDVIIGTHDPIYRPNPELHNKSIAIIGGNRGQYIGDLRLDFDQDKRIVNHIGRVVALDKTFESDRELSKLVREYEIERNKLISKPNN